VSPELCGYHGKYLRFDARAGRNGCVAIDPSVLCDYVGGVGLGAWILTQEMRVAADPLGAESVLVFALSPLVGTPLTTSAKFAVVGMSPLTRRFCDALASSHFAIAAKRAGVDAIAIVGRWHEPVILTIDGCLGPEPEVGTLSARECWGRTAADAEAWVRARLGNEWQVAAIGRAGEERVPYATISHDGRHAGRGGLGAVLGSKRVKAIAVRGNGRVRVADPMRTVALARELSARSFGPATEKYRELGTVANLLVFNRLDTLPTRNFRSGRFEGVEDLSRVDLGPARRVARRSCAACTIGCAHIYEMGTEGSTEEAGTVRLEYESLFALGPLCGVSDAGDVLRAGALCDELGLDTISTGGTVAFLAEAVERGLVDGRLPSGRVLRFGDGAAVIEAIGLIVERRGLGELLALGSRAAAECIGSQAVEFANHVKGLELPGYHPRMMPAMALGLAVASRGADHNRSGAYEVDFAASGSRELGDDELVRRVIEAEDRSALLDSLILCKFLRGVFGDLFAETAEMLRAVCGVEATADSLRELARRVVGIRHTINVAAGWTRNEDRLPAQLLAHEQGSDGLSHARLSRLVDAYHEQRGWTHWTGGDQSGATALNAAMASR
jgi:aldehyde:ferredoxin oxidoreductase